MMKSRMAIKLIAVIAAAALPLPFASAFSPSSVVGVRCGAVSSEALGYRNYGYDYDPHLYDVGGERVALAETTYGSAALTSRSQEPHRQTPRRERTHGDDGCGSHLYHVESNGTSLCVLLEPPSPPPSPETISTALQTPQQRQASLRAASKGRASTARRRPASPIVSLHTVQDYRDHVLHPDNENDLCVVRFKAPWCQTCRATGVAWERMASRLAKASSPRGKMKFLSVELDGAEGTEALKDLLGIEGVPQGVLHLPALGISEEKVKLTRPNLSVLKRNLERYCTFIRGEGRLQSGMLLDGLRDG